MNGTKRSAALGILTCLLAIPAFTQPSGQRQSLHPDAPPETRQFEFMLGRWKGTITSVDRQGKTSTVEIFWDGQYILDGWALRTDWSIPLPEGRVNRGTMIRAFDPKQRRWAIAEVYTPSLELHTFTAEWTGGTMVQRGELETPEGQLLTRRTFFNITPDRYENRYEVSPDGGRTWREGSRSVLTRIP